MTTEISPKEIFFEVSTIKRCELMEYFQFEDYNAFVRYIKKLGISREQR